MADDLSFNPPAIRTQSDFDPRRAIARAMRAVGYLIFASAVGTWIVYTVLGGLQGFLAVLLFFGTALIPWLINGTILVSWGGAYERGEATPRVPRSLALLLYGVVNALILFQIDEVDGFFGVYGWSLLAAAAAADFLGGTAIALTAPAPEAGRSGVAWRAWILVLVTALVLGLLVAANWDNMEFIPNSST